MRRTVPVVALLTQSPPAPTASRSGADVGSDAAAVDDPAAGGVDRGDPRAVLVGDPEPGRRRRRSRPGCPPTSIRASTRPCRSRFAGPHRCAGWRPRPSRRRSRRRRPRAPAAGEPMTSPVPASTARERPVASARHPDRSAGRPRCGAAARRPGSGRRPRRPSPPSRVTARTIDAGSDRDSCAQPLLGAAR